MSDETPRQLIDRRLREMANKALDVIDGSITNERVARGQQTRSADAWRVIDAIRGNAPADEQPDTPEGVSEVDELATRRAALQAALRAKRAEK